METNDAIVIGGNGAVGTLLCELLTREGLSVVAIDTRPTDTRPTDTRSTDIHPTENRTGEPGTRAAAFEIGNILAPSARLRELVSTAEIVVLAIPESVALEIPLSMFAKTGLVVETLSVKTRFAAKVAAETTAETARSILGINPMFAPSLGMAGRPVATVMHRPGAPADDFVAMIGTWGGQVVAVDSDTHDRLAAASQALTHAAVLAFGSALARLDVNSALLEAVAPPPARAALALLARIHAGEPEVYWDVQAGNPYAADARAALGDAVLDLDRTVTAGAEHDFTQLVERAGGSVPNAAAYADLCARLFGIVRGSTREGDKP